MLWQAQMRRLYSPFSTGIVPPQYSMYAVTSRSRSHGESAENAMWMCRCGAVESGYGGGLNDEPQAAVGASLQHSIGSVNTAW